MAKAKHPVQPIVLVDGVARFKKNDIVRFLLDYCTERGCSLNQLVVMGFSKEDFNQLYQLIGYSVSGFGDLSGADRKIVKAADEEVEKMLAKRKRKKSK